MKREKINTVLKWLATVVTLAGAVATTLAIDPLNIYLFNLGSVLWLVWAVRIKEASLMVVNAGMMLIYVYGFVVRITCL